MVSGPGAAFCRHACVRTALLVCLCAAAGSACSHAQAKTIPEPPPLDMPPPPPRSVELAVPEPPPPIGLPPEPARNNLVETSRSEPERSDTARSGELAKPEPIADVPPKSAEESARSSPPPTLQTTRAQQEAEVERNVRVLLARAADGLKRINYRALNPDARAQYDTARRFMSQAEDALRVKNLVFADNLADKAATLAAQLSNR